jgi:hypothetical protein
MLRPGRCRGRADKSEITGFAAFAGCAVDLRCVVRD